MVNHRITLFPLILAYTSDLMPHHLTSGKSLNTGESENAAKGKASLHDFGNLGPQTFRPAEDLNTTWPGGLVQ